MGAEMTNLSAVFIVGFGKRINFLSGLNGTRGDGRGA